MREALNITHDSSAGGAVGKKSLQNNPYASFLTE
jgi:hypothetical protein